LFEPLAKRYHNQMVARWKTWAKRTSFKKFIR